MKLDMRRILAVAALLLVPSWLSAQETRVTGQVLSDETGGPLAGVQVMAKGTTVGTLTDGNGNYTLRVPEESNILVFTYLGYRTVEQEISGPTMNVTLSREAIGIEGIVVTALGVERQARTVGVSTTQLMDEELTRAEVNLVNTLSGKVAGVNITNSGPQGGSSRIVIRGANSITGNNQPLFVVDGIPVDNSNGYDVGGRTGTLNDQGGFDYGNAISDINPDAIQSITVLKGPNAAALYGSRAANGAILIETKKGRGIAGAADIVVSQMVTFEDELKLPNYQNEYGQGYNGQFEYYDGFGNGVYDDFDESWGPPLDQGLMVPQFHSPIDPDTGERVPLPWVSNPDNVDNFFETGTTLTTNVSVSAATERLHGRAGFSRTGMNGMVPNHQVERYNLSFAGGMQATDALEINTSVQYITSEGEHRPGVGYGDDNVMSGFIWFGRQIDMNVLKNRYDELRPEGDPMAGLPFNWNYAYWTNPYFLQYEHGNNDGRNRLIGQLSATYTLTDWLSAMVRSGTDWYDESRKKTYAYNPGLTVYGDYTTNPITAGREQLSVNGGFGEWGVGFQETNHEFLLNATPDLSLPFTTTFMFGGNRRDWERSDAYTWVGQLATPGIYDVSNAAETPDLNTTLQRKRVNSLYGQAEFGYNDYLYLTFTGRNDWSSTLPEDHRSYFYPSVSGSMVFSDAFPGLRGDLLSFGKLRASWARVGNDTDPYRLRNIFAADEIWSGIPSFSVPGQLRNASLKPETTESVELGTELGFLNDRLGVDLTWYRAETRDQIMPVKLSYATGYEERFVNAGVVENKGWEVLLRGRPIQTGDFRWETAVTWATNDSKVLELAEGVEGLELGLGSFWGVSLWAREGEPLGQLVGTAYQRDPQGRIIVNADDGDPAPTNSPQVIGNVNPDWRAGWSNEFTYKNARLRFLFDMKQGGNVYSVTNMFGRYAGVLEETLAGRCLWYGAGDDPLPGYPQCNAETGIIVDGVNRVVSESGDTTYVENTTVISSQDYWEALYGVREAHVDDASYVKLREVTLSFDAPTSWANRLGVSGLELSVIGRNLALWAESDHLDPETAMEATNIQGFEYGQMPSARSIGFNVTVRP
jgi:TonB-linked SusC/RagA family outer membrane protein